ncbi:MAG TPA: flagellar hook-length control protein FliK [Herbaspirillum sp.]|jgi:flagellar hook-length control protein FliK
MNTLLPNLNATPIAPAARGFQADPQPSDASQSFSNTLREAADRSNNDNTAPKSGQPAPASQSAQNTQEAQNPQNGDDAQNAQATQQAGNGNSQVDGKKDSANADKEKADKDAAADSADKTSSELLALVAAGQSAAQMTPQAAPVAAPVTADIVKTDPKAKADDGGLDADGKSSKVADLAQALPDAWNAKAGKGGKDAKTAGPTAAFKPGSPAADNKAAANDAATGKTDAGAAQLNAAATTTSTAGAASAATAKAPNLQAMTGAPATNDNAMFNPALQQVVNASALAPGAAGAADKLTPAVGSPAWDSALGNKMVWMSNNGQQTATLTLNPRDLGPMQVTINVNKTLADATFVAANPEVKAALEAAMPKLREMMDQAGIQLGQANVSTGMPNQQQAFSQPQRNGGSNNGHGNRHGGGSHGNDNVVATGAVAPAGGGAGLGIVDTFV